jgi:hypothetical protein
MFLVPLIFYRNPSCSHPALAGHGATYILSRGNFISLTHSIDNLLVPLEMRGKNPHVHGLESSSIVEASDAAD